MEGPDCRESQDLKRGDAPGMEAQMLGQNQKVGNLPSEQQLLCFGNFFVFAVSSQGFPSREKGTICGFQIQLSNTRLNLGCQTEQNKTLPGHFGASLARAPRLLGGSRGQRVASFFLSFGKGSF